ncbi:MAG: AAA family ATPase [Candidatus Izemoplasmatales bacterium]|nr:AAA family ATPase [Candidatus Izemoplasmatales bacterium]
MLLDVGSLMFNMDLKVPGGNPSWGTDMGQGKGYKFSFEDSGEFLTGMLYSSVKDIENVWCPLGKGGNRQDNYEYVIAGLFDDVYFNNTKIDNAKFLLLIVKQIANDAGFHIGRRTLKYTPRLKYNNDEINDDCYAKIRNKMGISDDGAWFVNEIRIVNQSELHLIGYIVDKDNKKEFADTAERHDFVKELVENSGSVILEESSKDDSPSSIEQQFMVYLAELGKSQRTIKNYIDGIKAVNKNFEVNLFDLLDFDAVMEIYNKIKDENEPFHAKDEQYHRTYSSAVKCFADFIKSLDSNEPKPFESGITNGENIVVYGTPGCGKSYYVENTLLPQKNITKNNKFRTTFFQDYTNTDFVGQVLPKINGENVTYEFNPGPFTLALARALEVPNEHVALVIEELNRGNAASIFGDIFQLLDRKEDGSSRYEITNVNIQDYLIKYFEKLGKAIELRTIKIPGNMSIIATMNTSDQNVFTLDTAFKRRWKFEKLKNEFINHKYENKLVPGMHDDITWKDLVKSINLYIVENADMMMNEDKQIGVYFIEENRLIEKYVDANSKNIKEFAYKLFEYLWDDVAKFSRTDWFKNAKTLDQLIEEYEKNGQDVFKDGIIHKCE